MSFLYFSAVPFERWNLSSLLFSNVSWMIRASSPMTSYASYLRRPSSSEWASVPTRCHQYLSSSRWEASLGVQVHFAVTWIAVCGIGAFVVVPHESEEAFAERNGHVFGPDRVPNLGRDVFPPHQVCLRFRDLAERCHVLGGRRVEVVDECFGVCKHMVHEHGVFADCVVDLGRQHTCIGSCAGVDVFPLLQHLLRFVGLAESAALVSGDPLAGDADLGSDPGRFGEELGERFWGLGHG